MNPIASLPDWPVEAKLRSVSRMGGRAARGMSSTTERDDLILLGRIARRDSDAFAELFDRHSPIVLGVLIRMLGNRAESEEILQEAFLQAWNQAERYDARRASPRGWLIMLARSRALDRLRSDRARTQREEKVSGPEAMTSQPVGTRGIEAEERRRQIAAALELLPEEQRQCIELAFFDGLSHSQVATRLEQPLGTVKSRILLGMNKLRAAIAS